MLNVLRHYLPLRKALLVASETVLIMVLVMAVMSAHLVEVSDEMWGYLSRRSMDPQDARMHCFVSSFIVAVLTQVTIAFNELYDFRNSGSRVERMARFSTSAATAVLLVTLVYGLFSYWRVDGLFEFPGLPFPHAVVLLTGTLFVAFALLYAWRNVFHFLLARMGYNQRLLILGTGNLAQRLSDELGLRPRSGYEIVALYSPAGGNERRRGDRRAAESSTGNPWFEASTPPAREVTRGATAAATALATEPRAKLILTPRPTTDFTEPPVPDEVPTDERLHELADRLDIDDIIVAFEERRGSLPTDELLRCRLDGVVVHEAESFFERLTGKIPASAMRPSYLIFNNGFVSHPAAAAAKRGMDIFLSGVGLLVLWPAMLATALLVRLDSPGPILFRQERTGAKGRSFTLMKFRSMRADAEKLTGPVWAQENDPRITRVGRFIRKTRLDELPQLLNVLGGSMSLVGPRPERPTFVADLAEKIPYFHQRHIVKPGITGWAQINYPYGNTFEDALQKLQYDLYYIKNQSLLFDLAIVFNTIKTVVLRKGT